MSNIGGPRKPPPLSPARLVQLPGEQWAELRPAEEVSERLRRPIVRALRRVSAPVLEAGQVAANLPAASEEQKAALVKVAEVSTEADAEAMSEGNDYGVVAFVGRWSFPQEITLDGVLDLPARAYDALREAVSPLVNDLFVDATPNPEPTSPFVSSNGSGTPSTGVPPTTSLTSIGPLGSSASESP